MGRVFMNPLDNPFAVVEQEIESVRGDADIIFVDFHAEATSEKVAMGWHLDGKVTAVVGTHTHVQTADERILPHGTAYITDVGMTGPHESIIGVQTRAALSRFVNGMPSRLRDGDGRSATQRRGRHGQGAWRCGRYRACEPVQCGSRQPGLASGSGDVTDRFSLPFDDTPPVGRSRRRIFTVTELTGSIRTRLESAYAQIWVEGEISNARVWKTGHLYFTLKDGAAQLKAVMFRSAAGRLRFEPGNGDHVVARGRVSVYEPKGEYQIICEHLEPKGVGARQVAFERLRARLAEEGLFDNERKRPLPALRAERSVVVTSLDGAAVRDVIKVLARRYPTGTHRDQPHPRPGRRGIGRGCGQPQAASSGSRASMS